MHFKSWIYFLFLLKISTVLVFSDENPEKSTDAGFDPSHFSNASGLYKYMKSREDPQIQTDAISRLMEFQKKVNALKQRLKDAHDSNASESEILLAKKELMINFQKNEIEEFRNSDKTMTAPPIKSDMKLPEIKIQDTDLDASSLSSNDSEYKELLKEVRRRGFEEFSAGAKAFNIPDFKIPDDAIPDSDLDDDYGLPPDTKYLKFYKYMKSREDPQVERDGIYRLMAFRKKIAALNEHLKDADSNSSRSAIISEKMELIKAFQQKEMEVFRNRLWTVTAPPLIFDVKLPKIKIQDGSGNEDVEEGRKPLPIYMYFIIIPLGVVLVTLRYLCIYHSRRKVREWCMNCYSSGDTNHLV